MSEFNFKSQICTTREQSERLLALGLKKETADMTLVPLMEWDDCTAQEYFTGIYAARTKEDVERYNLDYIPAWSLHRLIEMMPENVTSDDWLGVSFDDVSYYHGAGEGMLGWKYYKAGNLYNCMIECYEWLIENGYFNKEYLENGDD